MKDYFVGILAEKRRSPQDDMVSILALSEVNGVKMSDEQIYGFMRNLLPAGAETTSPVDGQPCDGAVDPC